MQATCQHLDGQQHSTTNKFRHLDANEPAKMVMLPSIVFSARGTSNNQEVNRDMPSMVEPTARDGRVVHVDLPTVSRIAAAEILDLVFRNVLLIRLLDVAISVLAKASSIGWIRVVP